MICGFLGVNEWATGDGTLVASSEASALPASATQEAERTYVWRSLEQTADQYLIRDFGGDKTINFVAVANVRRHNFGPLKLWEGGSGVSPAWSLVATLPDEDPDVRMSSVVFSPVTARHWKLEWTNAVPAAPNYVECGYVGLGSTFEPSRACQVPLPWDLIDPSVARASVDGQQSYTPRTPFAAGEIAFTSVSEADLTSFRSIRRSLGRKTPFFFVLDSSHGYQQWLMRFAGDLEVTRRHVPGRYDVAFGWQEAL